MNKPIFVTQPFLPPLQEFIPYLEKIWDSKVLTNSGPFHQLLEQELCRYLGVKYVSLFTNATIALVTALQALEISGQVITTPYSFVATSHSLLWNQIEPIFVDVEPHTLNIDPEKIEAAITDKTTAILAVHCYGFPCRVDAIEKIARKYGLKVIYDAAHAFGVCDHGGSILNYGDLSILSFHATKVFNTFEGGAIISKDFEMKKKIDQLKNFGFIDEVTVEETGINGKMSEINAAFGLLQLQHIDFVLGERGRIDQIYRRLLSSVKGIDCLSGDATIRNYSYFPILVRPDYPMTRDFLYQKLRDERIFSRRYFYPLISEFPMYRNLPSSKKEGLVTASNAAEQVLCLPIYSGLPEEDIERIVSIISEPSRS